MYSIFFPSLSLLSLTDHGYSNNTRWVVNGIGHILALAACKWCVEDESLLSIWSWGNKGKLCCGNRLHRYAMLSGYSTSYKYAISGLGESDKLVNYQGVLQIKQMNHNTYKSLFIRNFTLMQQLSGSWPYRRIRLVKSLVLRKRSIYKVTELMFRHDKIYCKS